MPRDPFDDFGDAFNYAFHTFRPEDFAGAFHVKWDVISPEDRQLLDCIKKEATEYYTREFRVDLKLSHLRKALPKEQKERVVGFMKQRLLWYNENGFLLS